MTVYITPPITVTSDKAINVGLATYTLCRDSTAATTTPAAITVNIGQVNALSSNTIGQYFLTFDTTTIPTAAPVQLSLNITTAAVLAGDTFEVRVVSSSANKIAGGSLAAQTLLGSVAVPTVTSKITVTLDTALLPRSSSVILLVHSQKERLNTAPAADTNQACKFSSLADTTAGLRPQLVVPGPWSFVGVGTNVVATATPLTLVEPAGVADGDLLVACIASRSTATTAVTNTGWTQVNFQATNNTLTTGSAIGSGTMLYRMRSGAPDLTFDLPAGISVAMGQIVAYRGSAVTTPLDVSTAVTAAAGTAVSVTGLTTTQDDDLIVAMAAGGQEATWASFTNVTTPLTASGATDTTTAPSTTAWIERADNITTTGADTSLGVFDAVRTASGATGNLTVTASVSAGHVVIAGAFKIRPPSTTDAWDINDKSANITLSAVDKTATSTSATTAGVRSTTKQMNGTAGKYYAEFLMGSTPPGRAGIQSMTVAVDATSGGFHVITSSGDVFISSSGGWGNVGALASSDVLCAAWDAGAERVWFRKNGGSWVGEDVGADPGTGVNGFDVSFAGANNFALWMQSSASGASATLRTEVAEFTQTVPSGFTSWMGETSGPTAYNLPAVAGSYALTGATATTKLSRLLTATAGSYALTGTAATLTKAVVYRLTANAGSYALTGTATSLELGKEVLAVAGSYAITGTAASLERGRLVTATAGAYALTGQATSLEYGREVAAVSGAYALSGATAALLRARRVTALAGSYALTGLPANLLKSGFYAIIGLPGSYALTGSAATLSKTTLAAYALVAVPGSYTLTGTPATLIKGAISGEGPRVPYWGPPSGYHIPRKALKKAVRELLARERAARAAEKPAKRPRALARALVAEIAKIAPAGLGKAEKGLAFGFLAAELPLQLPDYFAPETIYDKGAVEKALFHLMQQALQRLAEAEEEDDEEAALLLLAG